MAVGRVWFIDTNLLAQAVLADGEILRPLAVEKGLPNEVLDAYRARHEVAGRLMAGVRSVRQDTFYVSHLALNELFQAVKDEARAILLFANGLPLSMWRDPRNNPAIPKEIVEGLYESVLRAVAALFEDGAVKLIEEKSSLTEKEYWTVFAPLLFILKDARVMDATLVTSAVLHGADYFVTRDDRLRKQYARDMGSRLTMKTVSADEAIALLARA